MFSEHTSKRALGKRSCSNEVPENSVFNSCINIWTAWSLVEIWLKQSMRWYKQSRSKISQKLKPYHTSTQKVINFWRLHFGTLSLKPQWVPFWSAKQLPPQQHHFSMSRVGNGKPRDVLEKTVRLPTFRPRRNQFSWDTDLHLSSHEEPTILSKWKMRRQIPCNWKKRN